MRTPKRSLAQRQRVYKQPPRFVDRCCICGKANVVRQLDDGSRLCVVCDARLSDVERMARDRRAGYARTGA